MKRKLINSFFVLLTSSMITKVFSILNRMILSRMLPNHGMALYILVIPTLSLCIILTQLSVPSAVFRLVSHPGYSNKKVVISATLICILSCASMIVLLSCFAYPIAHTLLKNDFAFLPILSMLPFIPAVAISGIIKNYILGKNLLKELSIAQFIEEITRLLFTLVMLYLFKNKSLTVLVSFAILSMSVGEICSIIFLLRYIKKDSRKNITYTLYDNNNYIFKDIIQISLPLTGSRLLHSLYNFVEPVILVSMLSLIISKENIHYEYAVISGYVIALLVTPTFINNVILKILIPILNIDYSKHNIPDMQKHILYSLLASFCVSLPFSLIFYFFPNYCLQFMYNTTDGSMILKYLSIPFILFYLQTPLSASLQVLGQNQFLFILSCIECSSELVLLLIIVPYFHVTSIAIVMLIGLLITLMLSAYRVYQLIYK